MSTALYFISFFLFSIATGWFLHKKPSWKQELVSTCFYMATIILFSYSINNMWHEHIYEEQFCPANTELLDYDDEQVRCDTGSKVLVIELPNAQTEQ